jgi:hypothetical protein
MNLLLTGFIHAFPSFPDFSLDQSFVALQIEGPALQQAYEQMIRAGFHRYLNFFGCKRVFGGLRAKDRLSKISHRCVKFLSSSLTLSLPTEIIGI